MILYLLRHGITAANEAHLYCGSTDLPLSEKGIAELKELAFSCRYPQTERIVVSGMKRTTETCSILYGDVPAEVNPDFRETDFGIFEMHSYEELKDNSAYLTWITGDMEHCPPPGGECNSSVCSRAAAAAMQLVGDGTDTVVITHGGVIAALLARLFQIENRYEATPPPGRGYAVFFEGGHPVRFDPVP